MNAKTMDMLPMNANATAGAGVAARLLLLVSAAIALSILLGVPTTAHSTPLLLSTSQPVLMIDGVSDGDATIDVAVIDFGFGFDFGYDDAGFNMILAEGNILGSETFLGGQVVDFAIRNTTSGQVLRLSDGMAQMFFAGDVTASNSENPGVPFDYWQSLTITWSLGNNDFVFNVGGNFDGLAPSSFAANSGVGGNVLVSNPEPSAALSFVLGFSLLAFHLRRRAKSQA
jgi:hypothetical protein